MPSHRSRIPLTLLALFTALCAACEAGPSTFDRPAADPSVAQTMPDSVDVSTLPELPAPAQAETTEVAEASNDSVAPVEDAEGPQVGATDGARFPHPDKVRGLYVNAWAAGSRNRLAGLLEIAARTEINTFVIDIKDASGYVSHSTELAAAQEIGATEEIRIRDLPGLLERLEQAGIYPIARIVVVKDPLLSSARPDHRP